MMIEDEVFQRKRFVPFKMTAFGFTKKEDQYIYEADLLDGAFHAILTVSDKGAVSGQVIDVMNDEEYQQLRSRRFHGAYVTRVRDAYEQWLRHIAENVCDEVLFASDQANRIAQLILNQYDVKPDFPWDEKQYQTYGTFRHADTRKWFALIMNIPMDKLLKNKDQTLVDIINLKSDTLAEEVSAHPGVIFPGYHMNHKTWLSIVLNDALKDEDIMALVQRSYDLT
ncbi:MAG: MmcQ/YjbR family DNA-binding protein [Intestinibaculum porci]|uniref:MmcQ/YjbR family DNA-binding protein n=1 Tax=Intestinibaculum porci TaxID=2487118 RepID=UPI003F060F36